MNTETVNVIDEAKKLLEENGYIVYKDKERSLAPVLTIDLKYMRNVLTNESNENLGYSLKNLIDLAVGQNTIDENFVSPRTLQWLYKLIIENGLEVTIGPSQLTDMVDITISKTAVFKGERKVIYETTCRDFVNTKHPFFNQHNLVDGIVRQVEKWEKENADESARINEIVKREHQ